MHLVDTFYLSSTVQTKNEQSTLINAITLEAFYGKATGVVTLNGVAITDRLLRRYAYMMRKDDRHWPYLTCRESLVYSAQLYGVMGGEGLGVIVDSLLEKVGLTACADVRCSQLTLIQIRLLSIGMAALKKPNLLFMDEPTTGE
jgi:ABC-type multidrug transport system ATPase subunit